MSSVPMDTVVRPALGTMQTTLGEILSAETETGTAVVQNADKVTTAVTEAARTQREAENFNRQADRLEKARASYTVPDSICSESASGTAAQVSQATRATASKLAGGGGVSSAAVRETLASLPTTPRQGGTAARSFTQPTARRRRQNSTVVPGCVRPSLRFRAATLKRDRFTTARGRRAKTRS